MISRKLHLEIKREYQRFHTLAFPETHKLRQRINFRRWRLRHPEKHRFWGSTWAKNNRDKKRASYNRWRKNHLEQEQVNDCIRKHKRQVLKTQSSADWVPILWKHSKCYWCKRLFCKTVRRTLDHIIPISKGGLGTQENLVIACSSCNSSKGAKLYWEWDEDLAS